MILAEFLISQSGEIQGFNIKGHAENGEFGQDIVCAAVSSAAYMTVNTVIEIIKAEADVFVDQNGEMHFKIQNGRENLCRDVLLGFKLHLLALEEQYPENINVNYTEV